MNKKFIVQKNEEIQKIIKKNNKIVTRFFILYKVSNNLNYNRYCISVSKKIGKAFVRNKIKRRIKDILMKKNINTGEDYVIIIRNEVLNLSYQEIEKNLIISLKGE